MTSKARTLPRPARSLLLTVLAIVGWAMILAGAAFLVLVGFLLSLGPEGNLWAAAAMGILVVIVGGWLAFRK